MIRRVLHIILLSGLIIFMCSCNGSNSDETYFNTITDDSNEGYADGTWCADVEYYNPNTGTNNSYELDVEVENNELIEIEWPNGGWLDETHFTAEDISDGECSFISDRGYEYTVTLKSKGGCGGSDAYRMQSDIEQDEEVFTCPDCGNKKGEFDDICYRCERKKEAAETCPLCYGYKMEWDKICENCKNDQKEESDFIEDNL